MDIRTKAIAAKLNAETLDPSAIDGDELTEMFELKELILLQKQITKAIERKVLG